jgi:hypothetical protein
MTDCRSIDIIPVPLFETLADGVSALITMAAGERLRSLK